jgi:hypothetical protein
LIVRYRPQGILDPSTVVVDPGHGHHGGIDGGC